jgi:YidC/Oxa1 family membrane protein insertase
MYGLINFLQEAVYVGRPVQSEPGFIVGPIAWLFGTILSFLFDIVYWITPNNSLGFAIVLLTIVAMTMMLPLGVKAQKSMMKMQQLNPEIEKIKAKYGGKNDAETKQKISQETQALWAKHKVNPLGSCLPMLIQMPLFFGLLYIMNQSYLYIDVLNALYHDLSVAIQAVPGYVDILNQEHLALQYIPDAWRANGDTLGAMVQGLINGGMRPEAALQSAMDSLGTTNVIVFSLPESLSRVLDRFTLENWEALFSQIPRAYMPPIQTLFDRKQAIEVFLGLPLKDVSGWFPPGVIIPILAVLTTMVTSWLSQQVNKAKDDRMKTQQTIMMVVMPLFMGFITVGFPAGVGVYWITMNLFRMVQQLVMNKQAGVVYQMPFKKREI